MSSGGAADGSPDFPPTGARPYPIGPSRHRRGSRLRGRLPRLARRLPRHRLLAPHRRRLGRVVLTNARRNSSSAARRRSPSSPAHPISAQGGDRSFLEMCQVSSAALPFKRGSIGRNLRLEPSSAVASNPVPPHLSALALSGRMFDPGVYEQRWKPPCPWLLRITLGSISGHTN